MPSLEQTRRRYHIQGLIAKGQFTPIECESAAERVVCPACCERIQPEGFVVRNKLPQLVCDGCGLEFPIIIAKSVVASVEIDPVTGKHTKALGAFKKLGETIEASGLDFPKARNIMRELSGIIPEPEQPDDGKVCTEMLARPIDPHMRFVINFTDFGESIKFKQREGCEQEFRFRMPQHTLDNINAKKGGVNSERNLILMIARLELGNDDIHIHERYLMNIHNDRLKTNYNPKNGIHEVALILPIFADKMDDDVVVEAFYLDSVASGSGDKPFMNEIHFRISGINSVDPSKDQSETIRRNVLNHMNIIVNESPKFMGRHFEQVYKSATVTSIQADFDGHYDVVVVFDSPMRCDLRDFQLEANHGNK